MSIEQNADKDLSLNEEDAERIVGGKKTKPHKLSKAVAPTYVPGDTGLVNPSSSGSVGPADASGTDDEC